MDREYFRNTPGPKPFYKNNIHKYMIDSKILKRYLAGKGGLGDKDKIIDWFSGIAEESSLRKVSFPVWDTPDERFLLPEEKAGKLLDRIHHMIRLQERPAVTGNRTIRRYIRILSRVAAVLFIPLVICLWTLRDHIFTSESESAYSELQCPVGTRTMFYLPDGSRGWLNGGSTLEFPAEFKGRTREVHLFGEAFFDVTSNPRKPFVVSGEHIQVKAYGTSFNVMAYKSEMINEVALVEGRIEIFEKKDGTIQKLVTLDPSEMCIYDLALSSYRIKKEDIEKAISWINGKLIFRDDTFKEVVKKCNRWYNVDIIIKDRELETYTYVGTFQDETLDEVLKLLALTSPIEYKDLGRKRKEDETFEKRRIEIKLKETNTH